MTSPSPTKTNIEILTNVPIRHNKNDNSVDLSFQIDDNEGNYSVYLSNLMDSDREYDEDIYDVKRDLNLFQNVNNWIYSKLQP